jgi:hypothetical protein
MIANTEPKVNNLDLECAATAADIARVVRDEGIIGKALGVLQEDGVYAFFLYLLSLEKKKEGKNARCIIDQATILLGKYKPVESAPVKADNLLENIKRLADNLDDLFLAKDLLERTLIYARYHAKAYGEEKKSKAGAG